MPLNLISNLTLSSETENYHLVPQKHDVCSSALVLIGNFVVSMWPYISVDVIKLRIVYASDRKMRVI